MTRIRRKKICPTCGGNDFYRYHRKWWMRLFSGAQYLRCRACRSTILLLRDRKRPAPDQTDAVSE